MSRSFNKKAAAVLLCGFLLSGCGGENPSEEIFSAAGIVSAAVQETAETPADTGYTSGEKFLECNYFNSEDFFLHDMDSAPYEADGKVVSGVVTHHTLSGKMIAGFFKSAAESRGEEIETVIITAPMHYPHSEDLATSLLDWQTPFGTAKTDVELSDSFISALGANKNDKMLSFDHSASALVPYVKYYLPEAKISCLLVSGGADKRVTEKIAELYSEYSGKKSCLFVFSIDFSHYLSPEKAEVMDMITREAVNARDIEKISAMTDDNLDSPLCMLTFIGLADKLSLDIKELDHSNSAAVSGIPYSNSSFGEGVTSYFIFAGTEDK